MSLSPALKQAVAQSRLKFKNNGVEAYEYSEIGIADQTFRDAYRDGYRDGYCCAQAQRRTLIAPNPSRADVLRAQLAAMEAAVAVENAVASAS